MFKLPSRYTFVSYWDSVSSLECLADELIKEQETHGVLVL